MSLDEFEPGAHGEFKAWLNSKVFTSSPNESGLSSPSSNPTPALWLCRIILSSLKRLSKLLQSKNNEPFNPTLFFEQTSIEAAKFGCLLSSPEKKLPVQSLEMS